MIKYARIKKNYRLGIGYGFPVILDKVPYFVIKRNKIEFAKINYDILTELVLNKLIYSKHGFTFGQLKTVQQYMGFNQKEFAKQFYIDEELFINWMNICGENEIAPLKKSMNLMIRMIFCLRYYKYNLDQVEEMLSQISDSKFDTVEETYFIKYDEHMKNTGQLDAEGLLEEFHRLGDI